MFLLASAVLVACDSPPGSNGNLDLSAACPSAFDPCNESCDAQRRCGYLNTTSCLSGQVSHTLALAACVNDAEQSCVAQ
jgi:hypothetical protein